MSVSVEESTTAPTPAPTFTVHNQKLNLDVDLFRRTVTGNTTLTISPNSRDLSRIKLNCRQCRIKRVTINAKAATFSHRDPYHRLSLSGVDSTVHQHHLVREKLAGQLQFPAEPELSILLPRSVKITDLDPFAAEAPARVASFQKRDSDGGSIGEIPQSAKSVIEHIAQYTPLNVYIDFELTGRQDGIQFVGCEGDDLRYPHAYTRNSLLPGAACSLFPCVDDCTSRHTWEISIKTARTLADALRSVEHTKDRHFSNGVLSPSHRLSNWPPNPSSTDIPSNFSDEDKALDIVVVGSGDISDEIVDPHDPRKKTTTFILASTVSPQQIGFAIGPFERIDLGDFRNGSHEDRISQNAIPLYGFCLPGRADEVRNTCLPLANAFDFFTITYGSYPFSSYTAIFVDDLGSDVLDTTCLSLCSTRLLFPQDVIDPIYEITKELIHALAAQWVGVDIVPQTPRELWAIYGISYFMTDMFMKKLCGNNEYRYRQKRASDRIVELDRSRPTLADHGACIGIDPSFLDFIKLKAPLVLFILDRRLTKASGSSGVSRIISRVLLNAKVGEIPNGAISNSYFIKTCERLGHAKLDPFFNQWVFGAGCPRFVVTQKFNKKKLVVEISIDQKQTEPQDSDLNSETLMREIKEDFNGVYAGDLQPAFQGPMTVRIHEADGTPYEHIIEIREAKTRIEIPYNTKYKRLKRGRGKRDKPLETIGGDFNADETGDSLLYCLGDVLQSEEDMKQWRLADWSPDDVTDMSNEHYEWVRMDADFEWICQMSVSMRGYMYLSQLQQDRDVVAQLESVQWLALQTPHPFVATIFIRTLMDPRYFHGIRTEAAMALAKHGVEELNYIGLYHLEKAFHEMFCIANSTMPQPNDFFDQPSYFLQCAIPRAIAKVRDPARKSPYRVRSFLYEKLRYNNNSDNEVCDSYYVSALMISLAEAMAAQPAIESEATDADLFDNLDAEVSDDTYDFRRRCLDEIDRHRRLDEWIPSYHNILSCIALECKRILCDSRISVFGPSDFLQYVGDTTTPALRVAALSNVIALGGGKNRKILRLMVSVLSTDPSPWIRSHVLQLFHKAISELAIGPRDSDKPLQQEGLIIEQDTSTDARQASLARRKTLPGALLGLKAEIGDDDSIKSAIWEAIQSPMLSIQEIVHLLDVCSMLYEPENKLVIRLKYPRFWKCERFIDAQDVGSSRRSSSCVLRFYATRVRTTKRPQVQRLLPKPTDATFVAPGPINRPTLKLKFGSMAGGQNRIITNNTPLVGSPAPLSAQTPTTTSTPRLIFKAPSRPSEVAAAPPAPPAASSREASASKPPTPKKRATTPKHSPPRLKLSSRQPSSASTLKPEEDDRSPEVEGKKRMTIKLKIGPGTKNGG